MFGLGTSEIMVILILALFIIGPNKLPELAATVGKTIRDLRSSAQQISKEITEDFIDPVLSTTKDIQGELTDDFSIASLRDEVKSLRDDLLSPFSSELKEITDSLNFQDLKEDLDFSSIEKEIREEIDLKTITDPFNTRKQPPDKLTKEDLLAGKSVKDFIKENSPLPFSKEQE